MTYDKLLADYLSTTTELKRLEAQKEELKLQILTAHHGGEESQGFQVRVSESTQDRVESLKAIEDKSPSLFKALHEAGCVKQVKAVRLTVKPIDGDGQGS
jgi:hypothetical protein